MKALLSFAVLITIFSEPFSTDGSPQFEKLDDILKKLPVSLIDLAKKQIEETDSKPWISSFSHSSYGRLYNSMINILTF